MRIMQNYTVAPRPITPPIGHNLDLLIPQQRYPGESQVNPEVITHLTGQHNVEVMVYQYDRFFGCGYWMTSIPTITHILIFCCILLGYCNI